MTGMFRLLLAALIPLLGAATVFSQTNKSELINKMLQHENNIHRMYLEYQKLYYEDKSRINELRAFEDLLSVYIDQVMEIFETLSLTDHEDPKPRDIASRTLVFKSLMYLEKAPLNIEYYEKACYEYYESLKLYENTGFPPVLYKELSQMIKAGQKTYFRLIDLIEDKGVGLYNFGKVKITFRNFMVTANFNPDLIELRQISSLPSDPGYTFNLAEDRIKNAFSQVFTKRNTVDTYVALPAGTYVLRLHGSLKPQFSVLTRLHVRPNQEQHYVMEPLADWIILYEEPSNKRPDFYKFHRNNSDFESMQLSDNLGNETNGHDTSRKSNNGSSENSLSENHEKLVAEIIAAYLPEFEIKLLFNLNDPQIKDNAVQIIAKSIVKYVESPDFYNKWNQWTVSWEIAREVRQIISPGSMIPVELIEFIHKIIKEL